MIKVMDSSVVLRKPSFSQNQKAFLISIVILTVIGWNNKKCFKQERLMSLTGDEPYKKLSHEFAE